MLVIVVLPDFQMLLDSVSDVESPAERPLGFFNGPTLDVVEVLMDLYA